MTALDTFVEERLPPQDQWPEFINLDALDYPERLNVADQLLGGALERGLGERPCIRSDDTEWTYAQTAAQVNRIANVLVDDMGLVPGGRVLLRAANTPMLAACYLAVQLAGGVAVPSMPLFRHKELSQMVDKAQVGLALCDHRLDEEMEATAADSDVLTDVRYFGGDTEFDRLVAAAPDTFEPCDTAADDPCVLAFTSGTTGRPKATVHSHRTILASCDSYMPFALQAQPEDVFTGSPPLAFTFGTGGLLWFPLRAGASTVLVEEPSPPNLAAAIEKHRPTMCFTSPTAYRRIAETDHDLSSLRTCVSAGETLPKATFEAWQERTGVALLDGIGSTEMIHIFISNAPDDVMPGSTGRPVPNYHAKVIDEAGEQVVDQIGRLAVRGPTGCLYLDDDRQASYVHDGWNLTGDAYTQDEQGRFWYASRSDDMIVSSGYNIAGPEVEDALMAHEAVLECAVVGVPDQERGSLVKAYVVLREGFDDRQETVKTLQDHVKNSIAPYKYPRAVEFVDQLPKTATGKIQRYVLRDRS
ncbi:benzoate-CoA ligase family protein [soil metagenome]